MKFDLNSFIEKHWVSFLKKSANREKVIEYKSPEQLKKEINFLLGEKNQITSEENLRKLFEKVVAHTPFSAHPNFLNYLYSGPDPVGLLGDWLISFANSNVHAYEASPVFSVAEAELIKELKKYVGFGKNGDGIFCPGGSYSNFLAMYCAKKKILGKSQKEKKLALFTSVHSHYSTDKAAAVLGLGNAAVYKVECDSKGKMMPGDLEKKIEKSKKDGRTPFFVCATAGTTVLGGFDPLEEISQIAKKNCPGIWIHVDAAWGGPILFSKKHKKLMKGVEKVDSVTWDFHKAMGAPVLCSALLLKKGSYLKTMFNVEDGYLFHQERENEYELGKKTFQCGRRGDAFKFWLMWQVYGTRYFEKQMDKKMSVAQKVVGLIKKRKKFLLYRDDPAYLNICFWYIPRGLRNITKNKNFSAKEKKEIAFFAKRIYQLMKKDGQVLVNFAKVFQQPEFFRLIVSNPNLNGEEIEKVLDVIESLGEILKKNLSELLISGGDDRLHLKNNGMNYVFTAPSPRSDQISRSSCTSSRISPKEEKKLDKIFDGLKRGESSFSEHMLDVHERVRKILNIDENVSIVITPSGTDSEFIPLLIAEAYAGDDRSVTNIMTGAGEIGSNSAVAAAGKYFNSKTPFGSKVNKNGSLLKTKVRIIEISQRDPRTGKPRMKKGEWQSHVNDALRKKDSIVLLHVLESSKLGYRIDAMDEVEKMISNYSENFFVVVDACQSRTDIKRVREYLKMGCMVMITGSKFEEAPPYCGAVLIPEKVTAGLTTENFKKFPKGLSHYITLHDISGPIRKMLGQYLRSWMNWGLMLRWTAGLDNWEEYRNMSEMKRTQLIKNWVRNVATMTKKYPQIGFFSGAEKQPGSVGDTNTIISLKLIRNGKSLPTEDVRKIYEWMTMDISKDVEKISKITKNQKGVLKRSFLLGQPVNMGRYAVIRIALGATLVTRMNKIGSKKILAEDEALLEKLSLLTKNYCKLKENLKFHEN